MTLNPQVHVFGTPENPEEVLGQKILEAIIKGDLAQAQCAHETWHGTVIVWSDNSAEQIGALVMELLKNATFEPLEDV